MDAQMEKTTAELKNKKPEVPAIEALIEAVRKLREDASGTLLDFEEILKSSRIRERGVSDLLPARPRFDDQIRIVESSNGYFITTIGCNTWVFADPVDMCVLLCLFLQNPQQMQRISNKILNSHYEEGGINQPPPSVDVGRGMLPTTGSGNAAGW